MAASTFNFAQRFLEFHSFCALGSARTLTAITRQRQLPTPIANAYSPKAAPQIVALGLLNVVISVPGIFL